MSGNKAVRVPRYRGEEVRRWLENTGAKDKHRLILSDDEYVEIPIYDQFIPEIKDVLKDFEIVTQKTPMFTRKRTLFQLLKGRIPDSYLDLLPRRYKILGDIILVKLPVELRKYKKEVGKALLTLHPRCQSVWLDYGKQGMMRRPRVELLAGTGSETTHVENGVKFKLDVTKVMFSPGNQAERMRMAKTGNGERVVDMFAGIGYFSIPMAVHSRPKKIIAIEINPESYEFLKYNIKLNYVEKIIDPILGDCADKTPENWADRVIMGHLFADQYIPIAIKALRNEGIIHYHEAVPESIFDRPIHRMKKYAKTQGKDVEILDIRKIKNYSPGVWHVVVDARIKE
jgi:tRNA wybutosine-synthesizing protein 2